MFYTALSCLLIYWFSRGVGTDSTDGVSYSERVLELNEFAEEIGKEEVKSLSNQHKEDCRAWLACGKKHNEGKERV